MRLSDRELIDLQNRCLFHIMPSESEGWGHAYHEGLSCGALMVSHDGLPMNEFYAAARMPFTPGHRFGLLLMNRISPLGVKEAVDRIIAADPQWVAAERVNARTAYETEAKSFEIKFKELFE